MCTVYIFRERDSNNAAISLKHYCYYDYEVVVSVESKSYSQNLEVYARLESSYVSICKLQALYFVTNNFWESPSLWLLEILLQSTYLWSVPLPPPKSKLIWQPKWHLTSVEDFNITPCPEPQCWKNKATESPRLKQSLTETNYIYRERDSNNSAASLKSYCYYDDEYYCYYYYHLGIDDIVVYILGRRAFIMEEGVTKWQVGLA